MDDLISRQAALALVKPDTIQIYDDKIVFACGASKKDLEELPTIAAVKIVRCKDCKHSRTDDSNYDCYRCELTPGCAHFANSYCDMGERRDDAKSN